MKIRQQKSDRNRDGDTQIDRQARTTPEATTEPLNKYTDNLLN